MTILTKISTLILALGFVLVVASCGKDENCYTCDAFTEAGIDFPAIPEFCEQDGIGGGTAFDLELASYQAQGYTCNKK